MSHPTNSTGRDKLASMRAAEERKSRQRKMLALLAGIVAVIVAVVAVMWAVSNNDKNDAAKKSKSTEFVKTVETLPASTFDKVGVGTATNFPKKLDGTSLQTKDGKPRVVYYGAEFCPFCAMERWSLVAALSRFGTWSNVGSLVSSEASIPSMDFRNAKFSSKYLDLTTYETTDQNHNELQKPSAEDQAFFQKYNVSKYTGGKPEEDLAIPYLAFGGMYATAGSTFNAAQDMTGKSTSDIADKLSDTNATTTKGIVGGANVITAQVCKLTKGQPGNVCDSAGVKAAAAKLDSK